jgi:hypothetical protein
LLGAGAVSASGGQPAGLSSGDDGPPGPRCYKKEHVPAEYAYSKRLVRKARLVHEETESGQIELVHYPAIYIEEKTLVEPAYVLLQEVPCTRRILRTADRLPNAECVKTRGCEEVD